jgi:hypothetical protein
MLGTDDGLKLARIMEHTTSATIGETVIIVVFHWLPTKETIIQEVLNKKLFVLSQHLFDMWRDRTWGRTVFELPLRRKRQENTELQSTPEKDFRRVHLGSCFDHR